MSFNPVFQTDVYKKQIAEISAQSIVECKFMQVDGVGEIIAVYPQISTVLCEVSSGRINYTGRLVCTLVYIDDSGKFCRVQKGVEFSHYADDENFAPSHTAICTLKCQKTTLKREGSAIVVSAVACANMLVFANAERTLISGAEGVVCKTENLSFSSAQPFFGESEVEDEFEVDGVADVLVPTTSVHISRVECVSGEIKIEGELFLSVLAIRGDSPVSLEKTVPYKALIPCDNGYLLQNALCFAEVKDLTVTASVNEEAGRCQISIVAALGYSGVFYEQRELPVAVDAFSAKNAVELSFAEEVEYKVDAVKTFTERLFGLCATKSKLDYSCTFKATALPTVEYFYNKETAMLEGVIASLLIYEQNGEERSTEINLPFAVNLANQGLNEQDKVQISVAVSGVSVRRKNQDECEAEAVLKIYLFPIKCNSCRYITQLTQGEELNCNKSAVSVFIPKSGDSLWEVAKRLKMTPQEVTKLNAGLEFPLTGKERIIIYRAK
ncbi:MAG: hypothetical protein E7370_03205 [Clostridiales bacterium]|nr:hypothetical protein [Clostridiales bacterium]